jgi:hypothetical protein
MIRFRFLRIGEAGRNGVLAKCIPKRLLDVEDLRNFSQTAPFGFA